MPAHKAFVLPKWLMDLKLQSNGQPSLYTQMPNLMHWLTIENMELELLLHVANNSVAMQMEALFQEIKQQTDANHLVARLSLSHFIRKQVFLTIVLKTDSSTVGTYVLRTTNEGKIEGVRMAAEHQLD
jgi:hypothetical protein